MPKDLRKLVKHALVEADASLLNVAREIGTPYHRVHAIVSGVRSPRDGEVAALLAAIGRIAARRG